MQFVDDRVGWAAGSGQIVRTTNGGKTWSNLFDVSMAQLAFAPKKLSAPTRDACWVIDTIGSGETRCLFTVDRVQTWLPLELGIAIPMGENIRSVILTERNVEFLSYTNDHYNTFTKIE